MVAEMKGKWLFNFTSLVHHNKHNLSNRSRTLTLSLHDKILTIFRGCNRCEVLRYFMKIAGLKIHIVQTVYEPLILMQT